MKSSRLLFVVATLALTLLFTVVLPTTTASADPASAPVDTRKLIKAVDAKAGTVSIQYQSNKSIHVFKVDDFTTIRVNGNLAKIGDIKGGMLLADSSERNPQTLDSISVVPVSAGPKAK
jgi:hypothetical protein